MASSDSRPPAANSDTKLYELKEHLLTLTTMVATVTYVSGLNLPGGAWEAQDDDGHLPGDPILRDIHYRRYLAFYYCNATALASSLVACLILSMLRKDSTIWRGTLWMVMVLGLLGLMGSYATGSCRDAFTTMYALLLACPVLAHITYALLCYFRVLEQTPERDEENLEKDKIEVPLLLATFAVTIAFRAFFMFNTTAFVFSLLVIMQLLGKKLRRRMSKCFITVALLCLIGAYAAGSCRETHNTLKAGLDPPGGLWQDSRAGHKVGYPVLRTTHPARYKVFFYSNSAAFVTSLVVVMMVQSRFLVKRRTLLAAMVLDLIGLVIAYTAGSTREAFTSICIVAMGGLVISCAVIHIALGREEEKDDVAVSTAPALARAGAGGGRSNDQLESKRQVLLIIAILVAALTYQAGLTPPGGFLPADDDDHLGHRHRAGGRYKAFFYCNAVSFMASVVLILLLVNRRLYRPAIRCYSLHVCMAVGMLALMGAYACASVNSSQGLKTSIYVWTLVAAVAASLLLQLVIFCYIRRRSRSHGNTSQDVYTTPGRHRVRGQGTSDQEQNEEDKVDAGGNMHFSAGNPILHDISLRRYNIFFYSNSASFMASIIVMVTLLPLTLSEVSPDDVNWRLWPVHTVILMDMLALLLAYAAGSTRTWKSSRNVIFLILPVLAYIGIYAGAAACYISKKQRRSQLSNRQQPPPAA
ncbi:hypothetical protein ACQ4PT_023764 [Festuca glaucescens]